MRKKLASLLVLAGISISGFAQKVVGYIPDYQWYAYQNNVQFSKLTDVIYSFLNPTTTGGLSADGGNIFGFDYNVFDQVKVKCKANNVKLHIAIGGADQSNLRSARLSAVAGNDTYRATFIANVISFAKTHGLAGIDIDWEFPTDATAKANHLKLIRDFRAAITATAPNLILSMACGGEYLTNPNHLGYMDVTTAENGKKLIDYLDYVNIMAYDVPTNHPDPGKQGTQLHHSSLACAIGILDAYKNTNGFPYNKMILGVPFYGKGATNRALVGGGVAYKDLLGADANALNKNNVTYQGSVYYYNGKTELEDKITQSFAKGVAGIMIWDVCQDVTTSNSLLTVIKNKVDQTCPVPQPNLGLDQSVCKVGDTKIFDAGQTVGGATGITAQWFFNNGSISGQTAKTYTASQAGTYKVVLTKGTCSKEDEAVLSVGSNITTNGSVVCEGKSATLSVVLPSTGSNFTWWDAAVGGKQVSVGNSRDYTIASATTSGSFYAQEESESTKKYTRGRSVIVDNADGYAWITKVGEFAQFVTVNQNLTITSVKIYVNKAIKAGTKAKLVAYNADGKTIAAADPNFTTLPTTTENWFPVTLNTSLVLAPGTYFICLDGEKLSYEVGALSGIAAQTAKPDSLEYVVKEGPTVVFKVQGQAIRRFSATGFINQPSPDGGLSDGYGSMFDLTIQTGAAASTCGRAKADLTVNLKPANAGIITGKSTFVSGSSAQYTVPQISGATSYKWTSNVAGVTFSPSDAVPNPTVTFNPTTLTPSVILTVYGLNDCGNGIEANFPLNNVTAIEDIATSADVTLAPNPFENNISLTVSSSLSDAYSVKIFNALGTLVSSSDFENTSTVTLGDNLSAGFYLLQVVKGNRILQSRVIKR